VASCPRCGGELDAGATRCEECGHVLASAATVPAVRAGPPPSSPELIARLGCGMLTVMLFLISLVALIGLLVGGLLGAAGLRVDVFERSRLAHVDHA
jgi:hypothetical protein